MTSQDEKDAARSQLLKNHAAYDDLITKRMAGTVSDKDFKTKSTLIEQEGIRLRNIAGIITSGVGGVNCNECGQFFSGPNVKENQESFDACNKHRASRIIQLPHPARN